MKKQNPRNIVVQKILLENGWHLEVEVYYHEGGTNFFTYQQERRGYYLSFGLVKFSEIPTDSGGTMKMRTISTGNPGVKTFIKEATRFSARILDELAATATQHADYPKLMDHVLSRNNTKIATTPPPAPVPTEAPAEAVAS